MVSRARWCLSVGLAVAALAGMPVTAAQIQLSDAQGRVVRDRPPIPTTGTGLIKGRVVDGVSGAAVPRARVRLQGGAGQRPSVLTDGAGGFVFKNLPAGAFILSVDKSTYMPARHPDAGRTLRNSAKPIMLQAGESIDAIAVPLFHGTAITGRVVDANGDPIESADVRLLRLAASGGRPTMRNGTSTNDLGEFRLGKLEPGSYIVMATARRMGQEEPIPANIEPAPQPVPSYYPGVTAMDLAQPIRIERGQTVGDIEITLAEGVPAIVSGTLVGEDGQPITTGGFVMVRAMVKDMPFPVDTSGAAVRPDGTFRTTLAPGDYVIEGRAMTQGGSGGSERMGFLHVSVSGNLEGLTILVGGAATATGRVIFEGTSPLPSNPQQVQFQVFAYDGMGCRQGRMTIAADWTFTLDGLAGTCAPPAQTGIGAWVLKSVQINGEELEDQSITFEPGQRLRNVQVVFTDRRAGVTFQVTDEGGQPTREYVGLAFPVTKGTLQPSSVRALVPPSDEMLAQMAAANGGRALPAAARRESIPSLRAGEYYMIAIDDISTEDSRDPVLLARLAPSATRVTIGEAPDTPISLRRQKLADILKR